MADISKIKLPNGTTYNIKDNNALPLTGGSVTGPVSFGDSVSIDEATIRDLVVNGSASFTNDIKANAYNGGHPTYFIKGTQTAATNIWTGTLPDGVTYYNGLTIDYLLPYAGTSSAATLNLSGLGAKPVYYGNSVTGGTTTHYGANTVIHLTYVIDSAFNSGNGCWKASNYYDSNTVDRLRNSYFRPYAGEAIYRYKFVMQGVDNRIYPIVVTNQTNTTQVAKVPTQVSLRPGHIWYYNTTGTIAAGAVVGANSLDSAYQTTSAVYNFNTDIAAYRMLYLKGTYNKTTDLFTLYKDSSSPCTSYYTQVPTNTANITLSSYFTSGYYYILLGGTYSSANYICLFDYNPLYYFDGTNLIPISTKIAQDTNTTYSAGTGISLSGTTFSAKLGYTTSGNNRAVQADSNGNLYITQKDDNSGGTVTKVTAGTGLSIGTTAQGNFTTSGTINHTNSVTAQTTQAVYPIKIDAQGHISAYGSAVTIPTVPSNIVNTITTTAGAHTAISSQKGNVSFKVPTKTSHLTNDSGFLTSHLTGTGAISVENGGIKLIARTAYTGGTEEYISSIINHTVQGISGFLVLCDDGSGDGMMKFFPDMDGVSTAYQAITNQIPTKTSDLTNDSGFITTDTNTTYTLSGALSSHKFTSTITAGGSGSGTSTSDFTLAAGTGITITDDTSARKMTIACSVTNTDAKVTQTADSGSSWRKILTSYNSGSAATTSITSGSTNTSYYNNNVSIQPSTGSMYIGGSYYMYLNASTSDALYSAINDLGWTSDVIE